MVHFVGAGSGAPDLITVRGQRLIAEADVIIYAGSLVNPALLENRKEGCRIYDSAKMTLEEVADVMRGAHEDGLETVRLHTGDPCIYGAVREQMDLLEADHIPYDSTPGVSAFCGAAAAMDMEYTLPGISQSVVITRMAGRTPMPERESIESFAAHGATMVIFLSAKMTEELRDRLLAGGYGPDTPAAIIYKATWPEEEKYICTVDTLAQTAAAHKITKTALIIVGDAAAQSGYERSKLYDPSFATAFRRARASSRGGDSDRREQAGRDVGMQREAPVRADNRAPSGLEPMGRDVSLQGEAPAGGGNPFSRTEFTDLIRKIRGADPCAMKAAAAYLDSLAAPPGSLGKLADAAVQLAGITGKVKNSVGRRRIIVMCADNGVVEEGVSSTPQAVTLSQAVNMTRHLTGMSSMAAHFGCEVEVVDVGIAATVHEGSDIVQRRIRSGTGNIAREAAMTRQEALTAIGVGIERARQASLDGIDVIGVGEMGIGNTTTSSAVLAALTGLPVEEVTGRGGGLTEEAFARKKSVIKEALRLHGLSEAAQSPEEACRTGGRSPEDAGQYCAQSLENAANSCGLVPADRDPVEVLARVGGLDLAAMCGVYLGAALYRIPVVVDGFISIVAALCAQRLCGACRDFMFPSHVSEEIGYVRAAEELGLEAWLHLRMRLGEGSGCPLAFQVLEAACVLMNDMATFEEARIDDSYLAELRTLQVPVRGAN